MNTCPPGEHVWEFKDGVVEHRQECLCGHATWPNPDLPQKFAPSPTARPRIKED